MIESEKISQKTDVMPSYRQILLYINNRRSRIGEKINLDEFRNLIEKKLTYNAYTTTEDKLFTFGVEYGKGRWRRKIPLYMSPVKSMPIYVDNGDSQIDQSQSQSHCLREVLVTDDVMIGKPKRGRPRKSG